MQRPSSAPASLSSVIQERLGPRRQARLGSRTRLLLCGSAMSVMGRLLSGTAPLRGRAGLELVVHPFGHRTAAEFWGLTDAHLALQVHAVVGGTPVPTVQNPSAPGAKPTASTIGAATTPVRPEPTSARQRPPTPTHQDHERSRPAHGKYPYRSRCFAYDLNNRYGDPRGPRSADGSIHSHS